MNKTFLFLFIIFATMFYSDMASQQIVFANIKEEYSNIEEIDPWIYNYSDSTVHFYNHYCMPIAHIQRKNEGSGEWETIFLSERLLSTICSGSIELTPFSKIEPNILTLGLYGFTSDSSQVHLETGEMRPINGVYKLVIPYSLKQFDKYSFMKVEIVLLESEEFIIKSSLPD